jgi:hypothetical protein
MFPPPVPGLSEWITQVQIQFYNVQFSIQIQAKIAAPFYPVGG